MGLKLNRWMECVDFKIMFEVQFPESKPYDFEERFEWEPGSYYVVSHEESRGRSHSEIKSDAGRLPDGLVAV